MGSDNAETRYGSKGQTWHPAFIEYMKFIAHHPYYEGMPDAFTDNDKIQWEAPSNRGSGRFKDTHHKRRDWWIAKAGTLGISTSEPHWISRTAKTLHPTGEKPCKRCGTVLKLAYVYPGARLSARSSALFGATDACLATDDIRDYVRAMYSAHGDSTLALLPKLFGTSDHISKSLETIEDWIGWINSELVARECALLSPGAMSNAPDRFDGFHSFNRCCRGQADTGRNPDNLRQYVTDRRAFEFWSEGNWVAADRMMALVRTRFASEPCADGGDPPPTADHIGPVSLGFKHSPIFRLLSRSANSAKNNRMTLADVQYLRELSRTGEAVASWFAEPLWLKLMHRVENDEHALRLSKILRDHHRIAMSTLCLVYERGHVLFLSSLLSLECADYEYDFENLRIEEFITSYDGIKAKQRLTKYAVEQKARRIRVGFASLKSYGSKENRHGLNMEDPALQTLITEVDGLLTPLGESADNLNSTLLNILSSEGDPDEQALRELCADIESFTSLEQFNRARSILTKHFQLSADLLSGQWDDERYVRGEGAFS